MKYAIVEYKAVSANGLPSLNEIVNNLISQGWEPQGGICTLPNGLGGIWYAQAMIRRDADTVKGFA